MTSFAKWLAISTMAIVCLVSAPTTNYKVAEAQQFGTVPTVPSDSDTTTGRTRTEAAPTPTKLEVARDTFRRSLIKAAHSAASKGEITRREAITVRIATFSPAFLERAEDLCVVQMAFSGEDAELLPRTETGDIDRTAIDWEGFAAFLERIIPLILSLLKAFGI